MTTTHAIATVDEALREVADHYVACCEANRPLLEAARMLADEVARLRDLSSVLRDQRDAARERAR